MHLTNTTGNSYVLNQNYTLAPNASAYVIADSDYQQDSALRQRIDQLIAAGEATSSDRPAVGAIGSTSDAAADERVRYAAQSYRSAAVVAPSDSADLAQIADALYIGGAGNISLVTDAGNTVTFTGLVVGQVLRVRTKRVRATATTATNIVALNV